MVDLDEALRVQTTEEEFSVTTELVEPFVYLSCNPEHLQADA